GRRDAPLEPPRHAGAAARARPHVSIDRARGRAAPGARAIGGRRVTGDPALRFDHVVKEFGDGDHRVRALDGVSLSVPAGTFVAVVGGRGSGKRTLVDLPRGRDTES